VNSGSSIAFEDSDHLAFGSFKVQVHSSKKFKQGHTFIGNSFSGDIFQFIKKDLFLLILDQRQAGYSDEEIVQTLDLIVIPPSNYIYCCLNLCSECLLNGHLAQSCAGIACLDCHQLGTLCAACASINIVCSKCLENGHLARNCLVGLCCKNCCHLGHWAIACPSKRQSKQIWKKKIEATRPNQTH
jgi:hypothetical protein